MSNDSATKYCMQEENMLKNTDNNRLKLVESWYRKVTQRTKSPELRLGEISMLLVSGGTEKHLYFRAEKLRRIKSRG